MPSRDIGASSTPVRMERIAVVAPTAALRDALVRVAAAGTVELDPPTSSPSPGEAARYLVRLHAPTAAPALSVVRPDLDALVQDGRVDLLSGEAQLEEHAAAGVTKGSVTALTGWTPTSGLPALNRRLAEVGGSAAQLPRPLGVDPPTLMPDTAARRPFAPLVTTYATVPYADVDPTVVAGLAYVVMFGAMFADAGQGAAPAGPRC